ncbi:MAG: hypothetical protein QN178_01985 [Armatimonadota bacterium]|nr:hypothetical protein [Armatimonadota bacterium]
MSPGEPTRIAAEAGTPARPGATPPRLYAELFLISFLILFFELACIRWFASSVVFLTFFTNIVLLASFLAGIIVGGLSEHFSLVLGFNRLLLVALAFYILSAVLRPGSPSVA